MVNSIDSVTKQARQGSIAAIIQILNDKLADSGVRTRAMFDSGILQLLCESTKIEQLDRPLVVRRVRQILESISPRHVRRVNINCRIVREQQVLWLEEIKRDPATQVLWSEEITLARPNLLKQWLQDLKAPGASDRNSHIPAPSHVQARDRKQYQRGILGGAVLSVGVLLGGFWLLKTFGSQAPSEISSPELQAKASQAQEPVPKATIAPEKPESSIASPAAKAPTASAKGDDPFVKAIWTAEQTTEAGLNAKSLTDWLAIATQWQQASDLMSQVPTQDPRYKTAQERAEFYRRNSQTALLKAQALQTP